MQKQNGNKVYGAKHMIKSRKDYLKGKPEKYSYQWLLFFVIVLAGFLSLFLYITYHDHLVQNVKPSGFSKYSLLLSTSETVTHAIEHSNLRKEEILPLAKNLTDSTITIITVKREDVKINTKNKVNLKYVNDSPALSITNIKPSPSNKNNLDRSLDNKKDNNKKKKKLRDPYLQLYDYESDWGLKNEWKYIEVIPRHDKIDLKKDRRVIFSNITFPKPTLPSDAYLAVSPIMEGNIKVPRELVKANTMLQHHPLYQSAYLQGISPDHSLENVLYYLQNHPKCYNIPIFLTMATVKDDLYWQLIENFIYSMVKFNYIDCALLICVSDKQCMQKCSDSFFPCYNYQENRHVASTMMNNALPSVMEQIAKVKLFYIPKALSKGVNVFLLDLDVGFLNHPKYMIQVFQETPIVDILVQEDYIFIMNRTKAGWKQWFTEQLPNIGLFLCRGNNRTVKVFDIAWEKYLKMKDPYEKSLPGKDQNHVLDAMRIGRGTFGLKYAYFTNLTTPLLDKLILKKGLHLELGGKLMEQQQYESQSIAIHATCYEKSTKVMGLKASNAFWNPKYYSIYTQTITKPLLFFNEQQLLTEIRSLIWLAMNTNRAVIVPNILGPTQFTKVPSSQDLIQIRSKVAIELDNPANGFTVQQRNQKRDHYQSFSQLLKAVNLSTFGYPYPLKIVDETETVDPMNLDTPLPNYWPGFRVVYLKRVQGHNSLAVNLLEPSFYWRMGRDYEKELPTPKIVYFDPNNQAEEEEELIRLRDELKQMESSRIILHPKVNIEEMIAIRKQVGGLNQLQQQQFGMIEFEEELRSWANDSIGFFPYSYEVMKESYKPLPSIKTLRRGGDVSYVENILQDMRLCKDVFHAPLGNRTCFQVCK